AGLLLPLLAVSAALAQGPSQPSPTTDVSEKWRDFLASDSIFGDYADVPADAASLGKARPLVYQTARDADAEDGPGPKKRRAARALWVGVNLEYQGMLMAAAPAERQDSAWRCLALAGKLRALLGAVPLARLEEEALARSQWQQALLR